MANRLRRWRGWLLVAVLTLLACASCQPWEEHYTKYRYKLTLTLDTPDGVKSGATVVEMSVGENPWGHGYAPRGTAAYVDMGPGRPPLIALLSRKRKKGEFSVHGQWLDDDVIYVFLLHTGLLHSRDGFVEGAEQIKRRCREPFAIAPEELPDLVTFTDLDKPDSIALVDPNNLEATFGPGVRWRSITLQTTEEPVRSDLLAHIRWIAERRAFPPFVGMSVNTRNETNFVTSRDFVRDGKP